MAARSSSSPERIQEWVARLSNSRDNLENARSKADEAYSAYCAEIRAAFADGLSVTPIREATGLTTSRLYQVKAGRRT